MKIKIETDIDLDKVNSTLFPFLIHIFLIKMPRLNLKINWLIVLYVSCICGFLYQCYDLYTDYMSGKTVVNIKVETILNQMLPAITICYPYFHIPETLGVKETLLQELKQNYEEYFNYEKLLDNSTLKENQKKKLLVKHESLNHINSLLEQVSMADFIEKFTLPFNFNNQSITGL